MCRAAHFVCVWIYKKKFELKPFYLWNFRKRFQFRKEHNFSWIISTRNCVCMISSKSKFTSKALKMNGRPLYEIQWKMPHTLFFSRSRISVVEDISVGQNEGKMQRLKKMAESICKRRRVSIKSIKRKTKTQRLHSKLVCTWRIHGCSMFVIRHPEQWFLLVYCDYYPLTVLTRCFY